MTTLKITYITEYKDEISYISDISTYDLVNINLGKCVRKVYSNLRKEFKLICGKNTTRADNWKITNHGMTSNGQNEIELKCWPDYYHIVEAMEKLSDLIKNDILIKNDLNKRSGS
jgi:hypothetical protein